MERRELQHTKLRIVSLCDLNFLQQTSSQRLLEAMARSCVLLPRISSASGEGAQAMFKWFSSSSPFIDDAVASIHKSCKISAKSKCERDKECENALDCPAFPLVVRREQTGLGENDRALKSLASCACAALLHAVKDVAKMLDEMREQTDICSKTLKQADAGARAPSSAQGSVLPRYTRAPASSPPPP